MLFSIRRDCPPVTGGQSPAMRTSASGRDCRREEGYADEHGWGGVSRIRKELKCPELSGMAPSFRIILTSFLIRVNPPHPRLSAYPSSSSPCSPRDTVLDQMPFI